MNIWYRAKRRLKSYRLRLFKNQYQRKVRFSIENSPDKPKIYYFCSPIHPNLGDQAQAMCILKWFKDNYPDYEIVDIPKQVANEKIMEMVKTNIKGVDKIFIHSGYLMTELYGYVPFINEIVETFKSNQIVIFPQTINFLEVNTADKVAAIFNSHPDLTLICRDEVSFKKASKRFTCRLLCYPDFVTSLIGNPDYQFSIKRDGVLFVIRNDKEKLYTDDEILHLRNILRKEGVKTDLIDTTIDVSPYKWKKRRKQIILKYLKIFSKYRVVITDRYHGTIFSQVEGTPTVVIGSSDHKLSSGVKWFTDETFNGRIFYAKDIDEAEDITRQILRDKEKTNALSKYFLDNYWSKLYKTIN